MQIADLRDAPALVTMNEDESDTLGQRENAPHRSSSDLVDRDYGDVQISCMAVATAYATTQSIGATAIAGGVTVTIMVLRRVRR